MRTTYLQQTPSGIFYLRIAIPKALQSSLRHREIRRSLRTRDRAKAIRDAGRYVSEILTLFEQLDERMAFNIDDLKKAAARSAYTLKETRYPDGREVTELEVNPAIPGDHEKGQEALRQHKAQQSQTSTAPVVTPAPESPTKQTDPIEAPAAAQPSEVPQSPSRPHKNVLDYLEEYIAYKIEKKHWQVHTADGHRTRFQLFHAITGDCDVRDITEAHCRLFIDTLPKIPTHMSKHYTGMSHHQVLKTIAGAPGNSVERLKKRTRDTYREIIEAFFVWLHKTKEIPANPFKDIDTEERSSNKSSKYRVAYSTEDLQALVAAAGYLECRFNYRYQYWMILLALFSGGRENELAQLHVCDIQKLNGIWVFSFNPEDCEVTGKRVKSEDSNRWIPIHPKLIELGFLDFVKKMNHGNPLDRLFPELTWTEKAGYGKRVSEWFNGKNTGPGKRYLGVRDVAGFRPHQGRDFHAFRATITSYMRNECDLVNEQFGAVLGHANQTLAGTVYADPYAMKRLKGYIDQVNFDEALAEVTPYKKVKFGPCPLKKRPPSPSK